MPTCLLGLGSNLGASEDTLRAAVADITALPNLHVVRTSAWHRTRPIGGPPDQADFINGAAVIETTVPPLELLVQLQQIEDRHGRVREQRWAPRTLDIDLLLYGNDVSETPALTLPHPRMSFRRFVLEPASEIAPKLRHPTIGWPLERLLLHLSAASNHLAIVTPSEVLREHVRELLVAQRGARSVARPQFEAADHHWPPNWTSWLEMPSGDSTKAKSAPSGGSAYAAAAFPKLSVLLDGDVARRGADKLAWSTAVRRPGRGPTLRLQTTDPADIATELLAAADAAWS